MQQHIYPHPCDVCGLPALTYDDQGNARCVEHAAVFIPPNFVESKADGKS